MSTEHISNLSRNLAELAVLIKKQKPRHRCRYRGLFSCQLDLEAGVFFQVMILIAEHRFDHGQAFEKVTDIQFVCHAHATMQLHGLLANVTANDWRLKENRQRFLF